jgi:hypothetical protein
MLMPPSVVFIVGLQKSGTTLMTRLLNRTGLVALPWNGEGNDFWGNEPPFSPTEHPAGAVYQRHRGERGHEIGADDATPELRELLARRLRELPDMATPVIANKNPYNVVRLPWLRALFPNARIIAMVRRPVPNVFSLLKKHSESEAIVAGPEDGWWGVKPAGWRDHVEDDVIERCAWQWATVNRKLEVDRPYVDDVVAYHDLCRDPTAIVERVLDGPLVEPLPVTRCFDDEFLRGSELRSKNRYFWKPVPDDEPIEMDALDAAAVAAIRRICGETEAAFPELG